MQNPNFRTKPKKVNIIVEETPVDSRPGKGDKCSCFNEGDVFSFDFERCPQNFCAAAFHSLWPMLRVIEMGGRHPWDEKEGVTYSNCPDPFKPVIFKLEEVK